MTISTWRIDGRIFNLHCEKSAGSYRTRTLQERQTSNVNRNEVMQAGGGGRSGSALGSFRVCLEPSRGAYKHLVGAGRFERPTPCAQGRCATRLRYAPTCEASLILKHFQNLRYHNGSQIC